MKNIVFLVAMAAIVSGCEKDNLSYNIDEFKNIIIGTWKCVEASSDIKYVFEKQNIMTCVTPGFNVKYEYSVYSDKKGLYMKWVYKGLDGKTDVKHYEISSYSENEFFIGNIRYFRVK